MRASAKSLWKNLCGKDFIRKYDLYKEQIQVTLIKARFTVRMPQYFSRAIISAKSTYTGNVL